MQSPQKFDQHKSEKIADFGFKVYLFIWVKISTIKSNCQSIQRVFICMYLGYITLHCLCIGDKLRLYVPVGHVLKLCHKLVL